MEQGVVPVELQRCRFPVSSVPAEEYGCIKHLRLTDELSDITGLRGGQSFTRALYVSWALLLRAYVRNDCVWFALLSNPPKNSSYATHDCDIGHDIKLGSYRLDSTTEGLSGLEPNVQRLAPQYLATKEVNSGVLEREARGDDCNEESKGEIPPSDTCVATFLQYVSADFSGSCMSLLRNMQAFANILISL